MAIPDFQSIMLPLLELAGDNKIHRVREAVELLAQRFRLTAEERQELIPSGRVSRFHNNVTWARTYMKKAGLLEDPKRGEFCITERGNRILKSEPTRIGLKFLDQFAEFREFKNARPPRGVSTGEKGGSVPAVELPQTTPEEALQAAYQTLEDKLADELLDRVRQSSPAFFEQLVVDLLVGMDYGGSKKEASAAVGQAGDEGIDGTIKEDRLGLDVIYIQAKRWENTVGRPEIQRFAGALQGKRARKGVFMTTSSFSREAIDYASSIDTKVILINGPQLAELMIEHNVGVVTEHTYRLKRIEDGYFPDE